MLSRSAPRGSMNCAQVESNRMNTSANSLSTPSGLSSLQRIDPQSPSRYASSASLISECSNASDVPNWLSLGTQPLLFSNSTTSAFISFSDFICLLSLVLRVPDEVSFFVLETATILLLDHIQSTNRTPSSPCKTCHLEGRRVLFFVHEDESLSSLPPRPTLHQPTQPRLSSLIAYGPMMSPSSRPTVLLASSVR